MGCDVYANGMSIACKAADGKTIAAFPDVCFTPPITPATPPGVPIPYPNTAMASDTDKGSKTVQISGQEVMLKNSSVFKTSTGDEAGCAPKKGVITSQIKGKANFICWSMNVKFEGENVPRHLDLTGHNEASDPPNTPPWPYVDKMAVPGGSPEGETVKKQLDEKDKNRTPPNGPIDYQNSTIAGKDVSGRISSSPPDGEVIWVQLMDGAFRFASRPMGARPANVPPFPHPMLSKGEPVRSAGEAVVKDGKIQSVNRNSGHFQPPVETLEKAAEDMKQQGLAADPLPLDQSVRH